MTRLLQAVRAKARRGDILASLEHVARNNNYELSNVCDPETGRDCDVAYKPATTAAVHKQSSNFGFLKGIALAAGIAAADHLLKKAAKS